MSKEVDGDAQNEFVAAAMAKFTELKPHVKAAFIDFMERAQYGANFSYAEGVKWIGENAERCRLQEIAA